jgi:hypothetical protein
MGHYAQGEDQTGEIGSGGGLISNYFRTFISKTRDV